MNIEQARLVVREIAAATRENRNPNVSSTTAGDALWLVLDDLLTNQEQVQVDYKSPAFRRAVRRAMAYRRSSQ